MNKWISFDCYGTLVDWKTGMLNALEIVAPGKGQSMMDLHREIEGQIEIDEPYQSYRQVLAESVRRMAARVGVSLNAGDEEILAATLPFWPMYHDTNAALRALKRQGWKLAIFSNVDRDLISGTLRHFDVLFDLVITAQDVRSYKPANAHALRFLEIAGADPSTDWLYAAVNHQYDLIPGRALGARCVWINRNNERASDESFLVGNISGMAGLPQIAKQELERHSK